MTKIKKPDTQRAHEISISPVSLRREAPAPQPRPAPGQRRRAGPITPTSDRQILTRLIEYLKDL